MLKASKNPAGVVRPSIAVCLLLVLPFLAFSQNKKELEEKRQRLLKEMETTSKLLKKTERNREAAYDRFLALQSQIENREQLIATLERELAATDSSSQRAAAVIASLSRDIETMQNEYGQMMRAAFRRKRTTNPLLFLLSAESLNQMFRRWLFLKKYDAARKEQAEAIAFTKTMLAKKMITIEEIRREKALILENFEGQKIKLTSEMQDKNSLLQDLKKDESKLKTDLKEKAAAHEKLNQAIEAIIREEIRKKTEAARRPAAETSPPAQKPPKKKKNEPKPTVEETAANEEEKIRPAPEVVEDALSADFRKNRGKLPWPVSGGFIAKKFGKQPHPTIPSIEITNNGIDIRTDELTQVYAVFEGTVAGVQFIPGHDYTVILQHGDYYTVYSNLLETYVSKGEQVKIKQSIGTVSTNRITGTSELHFELWHGKERQNPSGWIK